MSTRLSPLIRSAFIDAGWYEGRSVEMPLDVFCGEPIFSAAASLIREFNGLHVFPGSPDGIECGTSDVQFDPRLAEPAAHVALEWAPRVGSRLFPLGEAGLGYLMLFVDEKGRIFEEDIVMGCFCLVGEDFASAMEALLLGRHLRPLLPPGTDGIDAYYGNWIPAGDPRIYTP